MAGGASRAVVGFAGAAGLVGLLLAAGPAPERTAEAEAQAAGSAVRYAVVAERSEVRYRVREQLAGLSFPNDAVGATSAVEGAIVFDGQGRIVAGESRFTVDVRTLRSDEPRRDNYIWRNTLETERYPAVVFAPVEARGLRVPLPATGTASLELIGDLTVRDVTRPVTWEARASFAGAEVSVRARTAFRFGDFGLRIPRVAVVLSVDDLIRLEADLLLRRAT